MQCPFMQWIDVNWFIQFFVCVCVCVLVIYNKKATFAGTVRLNCAEEQLKSASSFVVAPGRLFGGLWSAQIRSEDLSVCLFWFGRGSGGMLPLLCHSAIPPQDSPSGLSLLEPLWPFRHPSLPRDSRGVLRPTKGKILEGCRQNQSRTRVQDRTLVQNQTQVCAGVQPAPPLGWRVQQRPWYATFHFPACLKMVVMARPARTFKCKLVHAHVHGERSPDLCWPSTSSPTRPWGEEGWHQTVIQSLRQACNRPARQSRREREYSQMIIRWLTVFTSDKA